MPLENLTGSNVFITNLVPTNPAGTDVVSEGDDHLRGTKNVLLNSFPAINGPVTATPVQLNQLAPAGGAAFTGIPTAPTAAPGTSTTQIASTEFVTAAVEVVADSLARTWQSVTRSVNTDYTAPATKGVAVSISCTNNAGSQGYFVVNGLNVVRLDFSSAAAITTSFFCEVPAGATYRLNANTVTNWVELR